jgi:ketosteroid isomerase-like protein
VEDLIRELVAVYNRGDLDVTLAMVHEDAVAVVPDGMPNEGTYRGREGMRSMLESWEEAWESFSVELGDVHDSGDAATATVIQRGRGRGSGIEVELRLAWVVRQRDGLLVYWRMCESLDEARRLLAAD